MKIMQSILLAIPFYFLWNWLAATYVPGLPQAYQHIPFWHCVGLFVLIAIIQMLIFPTHFVINKNWYNFGGKN